MTDPNGAGIYGVPWIPSTKTPVMLALIYQHHGKSPFLIGKPR
jgi:hypothetical protein